jgi:hypothetical protein
MNIINSFVDSLKGFVNILFNSSISFWKDPDEDGFTYILTSGLGVLVISLARWENLKATALEDLLSVALPTLLLIVIVLGICVLFDKPLLDRAQPVSLVSKSTKTVLVCNLLSCFFIWAMGLMAVFNVNIAHLLGFAVVIRNTVANTLGFELRIVIWGLIIFILARISLGMLIH